MTNFRDVIIDKNRHLILVGSRTPEKILRANIAAKALGLPLVFVPLSTVFPTFRSALEDTGDMMRNNSQKGDLVGAAHLPLTIDGGHYNRALKALCRSLGIEYNLERLHLLTDDQTMTLHPKTWKLLKPKLKKSGADEALLKNADNNGNGGPGAEVGPLLGAVGQVNFYNLMLSALEKLAANEPPAGGYHKVKQLGTYSAITLGDPTAATRKIILAEEVHYLHKQRGHTEQASTDAEHIPASWDRLIRPGDDAPIIEKLAEHLRSDDSLAAKMVWALAHKLGIVSTPEVPEDYKAPARTGAEWHQSSAQTTQKPKKPRVLQPFWTNGQKPAIAGFNYCLAPRIYNRPEQLFEQYDAFLFPPFDNRDPQKCTEVLDRLVSILVATTITQPKIFGAPVIIMNHNGCYDDILAAIKRVELAGMFKNFDLQGYDDRLPQPPCGVRHYATACYDVVSNIYDYQNGPAALNAAASSILKHRLDGRVKCFAPPVKMQRDLSEQSNANVAERFSVGFFTNASNDNAVVKTLNNRLGAFIAEQDWNLVFGAGDRFGMGAAMDGYIKAGGMGLTGITTNLLAATETVHGQIPPSCHVGITTIDIDVRMTEMFKRIDMGVFTPGGAGTVQEITRLMLERPQCPLLLVDADLHNTGNCSYWKETVTALVGKDGWNKLEATGQYGSFRYTKTAEKAEALIREIASGQAHHNMFIAKRVLQKLVR